ncbi:hypothetical protein ACYTX9_09510, partial [Streptococcus pyogenes]
LNTKYMLLNRLGESFIKSKELSRLERFIHKVGMPGKAFAFMEKAMTQNQHLKESNLVPEIRIQDQRFGEISMETDGFYDKVYNKT